MDDDGGIAYWQQLGQYEQLEEKENERTQETNASQVAAAKQKAGEVRPQ